MTKYVDNIEFVTEECCNCGIPFAMTADFKRRRLDDRKFFYCPAGHGQHYTGQSEAAKLKDQLSQKEREIERLAADRSRISEQRDRVARSYTRVRDRVKNGVCPCCNRQFQQLYRHMRDQHPDYGTHDIVKTLRTTYGLTQKDLSEEVGVPPSYISQYEKWGETIEWAKTALDEWAAEQGAA